MDGTPRGVGYGKQVERRRRALDAAHVNEHFAKALLRVFEVTDRHRQHGPWSIAAIPARFANLDAARIEARKHPWSEERTFRLRHAPHCFANREGPRRLDRQSSSVGG